MKDSSDWIEFVEDHIVCKICGTRVERGIANVSGHWAICQGKEDMAFVNKVADSKLGAKDKLDLVINELKNS